MPVSTAKMKRAVAQICLADPKFIPIVEASPLCPIGRTAAKVSNFESLVESVISQQLAIRAADTIHARLVALANGKIAPARIAKLSQADLRSVGLSGAKTKTIQGLSSAALSGEIEIDKLHLLDDELVSEQLNSLWGIGPWTVDMFMMFQLGRMDTWPTGDLGVRRGWEKLHRLKEEIEPKKLHSKGEKFRPHRSVVAWYCWRAIENK
jgi:DNA-3-methyladenine glycosylase II